MRPTRSSSSICRPTICCAAARGQGLCGATRRRVALENFFRKRNLIALRELALRKIADRVDQAARAALPPGEWPRARAGRASGCWWRSARMRRPSSWCAPASAWPMPWMPNGWWSMSRHRRCCACPRRERNRRIDVLRLAESLGRRDHHARRPVGRPELLEYARTRHVTRLLVGAPKRRGWRRLLRPSTATAADRGGATDFDDHWSIAATSRAAPPTARCAAGPRRSRSAVPLGPLRLGACARPSGCTRGRALPCIAHLRAGRTW